MRRSFISSMTFGRCSTHLASSLANRNARSSAAPGVEPQTRLALLADVRIWLPLALLLLRSCRHPFLGGDSGFQMRWKNLFAPHPAAGNQGASPCDNSSRTDKASRPVSRHVAIRCPVPRALKDHPRALNPSHQIIRNSRTGARWTTDENPAEISRRIDTQHLQQAAPLTLPNRGGQALG